MIEYSIWSLLSLQWIQANKSVTPFDVRIRQDTVLWCFTGRILTSIQSAAYDNFYFQWFKNCPARREAPQIEKSSSTLKEFYNTEAAGDHQPHPGWATSGSGSLTRPNPDLVILLNGAPGLNHDTSPRASWDSRRFIQGARKGHKELFIGSSTCPSVPTEWHIGHIYK